MTMASIQRHSFALSRENYVQERMLMRTWNPEDQSSSLGAETALVSMSRTHSHPPSEGCSYQAKGNAIKRLLRDQKSMTEDYWIYRVVINHAVAGGVLLTVFVYFSRKLRKKDFLGRMMFSVQYREWPLGASAYGRSAAFGLVLLLRLWSGACSLAIGPTPVRKRSQSPLLCV